MGSWYSFDIHCAHCITCCSDHSLGSVETRDNVTLHVYCTCTVHVYMYMYCTRVHVLYTCTCTVHVYMYMYCTRVHVLYTCTCTVHVYMYMYCTRVHVLYTYICCTPFLIWMFVCSYNLKHLTLCTQERMYAYVQRSPHVGLCLDLIHVVRYAFYFPISARLVLHKTRFLTVQSDIGVIAIDHV